MSPRDVPDRRLIAALLAVAGGLLAVGVESRTAIRHVIQLAPAVVVAILAARGDPRARFAAMPVFTVWFLIMLGIWLFLLGLCHVITGSFTRAEIVLTLVIGSGCVAGMIRTLRRGPRVPRSAGAITLLGFTALQLGCVWLSTQPVLAGW